MAEVPMNQASIVTGVDLLQRYTAGQRDFSGLNLVACHLSGADLKGADLSYADLSEANLNNFPQDLSQPKQ
jgi:uncharacterized protein YjbI with pentapeptide repeats